MDARAWLLANVGLTACLWVPYVLDRFFRVGLPRSLANPTAHGEPSPWAQRARAAHGNAVENLAVFAPLVLLAIQLGQGAAPPVVLACGVYFFARLAHFVCYAAGVPGVRTLAFVVGFGAQATLLLVLGKATP